MENTVLSSYLKVLQLLRKPYNRLVIMIHKLFMKYINCSLNFTTGCYLACSQGEFALCRSVATWCLFQIIRSNSKFDLMEEWAVQEQVLKLKMLWPSIYILVRQL